MKQLIAFSIVILSSATAASAFERSNEINDVNVVHLMNAYRAAEGLPPLRVDDRLALAAADRMRDMEEAEYWSHVSPDGRQPFVWISARDYRFQYAAENLAVGFETARLLVASWMESPGHRANIMSPNLEDCGIAIIEGSTRGPATGRSIVVLFGKKQRSDIATVNATNASATHTAAPASHRP